MLDEVSLAARASAFLLTQFLWVRGRFLPSDSSQLEHEGSLGHTWCFVAPAVWLLPLAPKGGSSPQAS